MKVVQARQTTAANTAATAPHLELIDPGALRYLRENGPGDVRPARAPEP